MSRYLEKFTAFYPIHRLSLMISLALLMRMASVEALLAFSGERSLPSAAQPSPLLSAPRHEPAAPVAALPITATTARRLMPTVGAGQGQIQASAAAAYDPTSAYDQ